MNWPACSRLDEVRAALAAGHWPQASAPDLRAHVAACTSCSQEVLITTHLQQSRAAAVATARPGSASLLWWRAQVRRRNAALERAGRPLAAAHAFALILLVVVAIGLVATHWRAVLNHFATDPIASAPSFSVATLVAQWGLTPLLLAFALLATLGGVVVYLTTERQ